MDTPDRPIPSTRKAGVVAIDLAELACLMTEAFTDRPRPGGMTAQEAVQALEAGERDGMLRAATAAVEYVLAQMQRGMASHITFMRENPTPGERPN